MTSPFLESALQYAQRGWPVLPLHSVAGDKCTCGKPNCSSPGKHPLTMRGVHDATTNPDTVRRWWQRWPNANVGVATGAAAGIVALDIDPKHGGDRSLADLLQRHGDWPPTVEAETGGAGRHYLFAHPGREVGNRSNVLPGIDVRGDGGYLVVAPSLHASGRCYRWADGRSPLEHGLPPMPGWLLDLVVHRSVEETPPTESTRKSTAPDQVRQAVATMLRMNMHDQNDGSRRLFAAACRAVEHGLNGADALKAVRTYAGIHPFPTDWSDKQIMDRLRDATRQVAHGRAVKTPPAASVITATLPTDATPRAVVAPFKPFPIEALPEPARSFVEGGAAAIGCNPSYVALPLLAAIGSAIGNTRCIQLKRGWCEPAIIWSAIVGESGTAKTPAFKLAMAAIRDRQGEAIKQHAEAMAEYEQDLLHHDKEMAAWRRGKGDDDAPPQKPSPPEAQRWIVADTTIEALAPLLLSNPRGLLLARDELAGWVGSFDRYAGGKGGGDAANWLSMHNGEMIIVDRKTAATRTIYVPRAAVSVAGGIQPGILRRVLGQEHRESGLAARLLLASPPRRAKRWTEDELDPFVEVAMRSVLNRLLDVELPVDADGDPEPLVLELTPAGKRAWIAFYNQHAQQQVDLSGDLSAAWSKLEGYAARLALIVHMIRWAGDDPTLADEHMVDDRSIQAGVMLSEWFGHEARRVYAMIGESEDDQRIRCHMEKVQRKGGEVTVREWQRLQSLPTRDDALAELNELVEAGYGSIEHSTPSARGGRPSPRFVLAEAYLSGDKTTPDGEEEVVLSVSDMPSDAELEPAGSA